MILTTRKIKTKTRKIQKRRQRRIRTEVTPPRDPTLHKRRLPRRERRASLSSDPDLPWFQTPVALNLPVRKRRLHIVVVIRPYLSERRPALAQLVMAKPPPVKCQTVPEARRCDMVCRLQAERALKVHL